MNARGFTLIEILVVLVLTGILAAVGGMGIVTGARGFATTREAAMLAQQAQLAQDRITREIAELVDVGATCTSTQFDIVNIEGSRTIVYDDANDEIDIITTPTGGQPQRDTLIDNVTAMTFTYGSGAGTWNTTMDSRELSAVTVSFTLASNVGAPQVFPFSVVPRNNQNAGGTIPTSTIPSLERYDFCFIATAAYGDLNHPVVTALREFRDKALMPFAPGRALVRAYYTVGPHLAAVVQDSPMLAAGVRAVLRPLAALAQLGLHAPAHLALSLALCMGLGCGVGRALRHEHKEKAMQPTDKAPISPPDKEADNDKGTHGTRMNVQSQQGAVLLSAIVTLVAFAVLAASAVSIMTSSTQTDFFGAEGDKAYYLAEAGFNTAASMFLHAGDGVSDSDQARKNLLDGLDDAPFRLSNNAGSFRLEAQPFWFEAQSATGATNSAGSSSLRTRVYGTLPEIPESGRLRVGNTGVTVRFGSVTRGTNTLSFNSITTGTGANTVSGLPSTITDGTDIFLSAHITTGTSSLTVGLDDSLTLSSGSGVANFPQYNGMFTVRGGGNPGTIAYVYRERTGNSLKNIRLADGQGTAWTPIEINGGSEADITLEPFVRLFSTGITPGGTTRLVTYSVPVGWISGGAFNKEQFVDTFNAANITDTNWVTGGSDYGQLGRHTIGTRDGGKALIVTRPQLASEALDPSPSNFAELVENFIRLLTAAASFLSQSNYWSTIFFNWTNTNINMARAWSDAGYNLSYDAQVKINVLTSDKVNAQHFAGLMFRAQEDVNNDIKTLGLSLVRVSRERSTTEYTCLRSFLGICLERGDWKNWSAYSMSTDIDTALIPGYTSANAPGYLFPNLSTLPATDNTTFEKSRYSVWTGLFGLVERRIEKQFSQPALVLWKREGNRFTWLAYKLLGASNIISSPSTATISADGRYTTIEPTTTRYSYTGWPSILVRITEGRELAFTGASAGSGIKYGDQVESTSSGTSAQARVSGPAVVQSGGWNANGEWNSGSSGRLALTNVEGTLTSTLRINGSPVATASGSVNTAKSKSLYLRAYYGKESGSSANRVVDDETRNANIRLPDTGGGTLPWTPDDYTTWTKDTGGTNKEDNFTLVKWDGIKRPAPTVPPTPGADTDATSLPIGISEVIQASSKTNSILKLDNFTTADGTVPGEGIALVTAGPVQNQIAFDDFGLQLDLKGGQGFLPPIQQ